ncbi:MAG TPA: RIP metalloprotease [Actinomycetota bacterium]|nr:RIP metalloprotease [Actinomycetota bacterium]
MLGVVLFVVAILTVVMIHEAGHFLVAKHFDFKATKFFVGFGPTVWSTQRGETEYGIKALPLGGFVKIVGMNPYEDVAEADRHRSYPNKPGWQRALVLVAGSATHFVVGFVLLFVAALAIGHPTLTPVVSGVTRTIEGVETPAARAGFRPGDRIVAVDGERTESWTDVRNAIRAQSDHVASFVVERDGERRSVTAELGVAEFDAEGRPVDYVGPGGPAPRLEEGHTLAPFLGVAPSEASRRDDPLGALGYAGERTWHFTVQSVTFIDDVFTMPFDDDFYAAFDRGAERGPESGVGLVGGARLAGQVVESGFWFGFLQMVVSFTIVVGVMNLLPLPPLDGGHLAVVAWESVTGRKVDVRKLIPVAAAVIAFFVVLFAAMLYLDIANPLQLPN